MLKTETVVGLGHLTQEGIDLIHSKFADGRGMFIEIQKSQKGL